MSDQIILPAGMQDPAPDDFNRLAAVGAALGRPAIPALMLLARDCPKPLGQLCAIKAIGMMEPSPARRVALERIEALDLPGMAGWIVKYARDAGHFGGVWSETWIAEFEDMLFGRMQEEQRRRAEEQANAEALLMGPGWRPRTSPRGPGPSHRY